MGPCIGLCLQQRQVFTTRQWGPDRPTDLRYKPACLIEPIIIQDSPCTYKIIWGLFYELLACLAGLYRGAPQIADFGYSTTDYRIA